MEGMRRRPLWIGIGVMKPRKPDTKCEFTLRTATLRCRELFPAKKTALTGPAPLDGDRAMSRRPLVLLALAISSFVLSACSDISAPRPKSDSCSGYVTSDGRCIEQ